MAGYQVPGTELVQRFGREYGAWRSSQYLLPHDDTERMRLDIMHTMFLCIRPQGKRLTSCPTEHLNRPTIMWQQSTRVLDLGCGTGIWMLEMARKHKHTEFVGVDIHRMGPQNIEGNVNYQAPWDYDGPWALGEKSWDMIHLQMGLGSIWRWEMLFHNIREHLVPGTGWFEFIEMDYEPLLYPDERPLKNGRLADWWQYMKNGYKQLGRRIHWDPTVKQQLEILGFKDITVEQYMIPLNDWHTGIAERRAAAWWQVAMGADQNSGKGLEALSLAVLCRHNTWTEHDVRRFCQEAMEQALDSRLHVYNTLRIVKARCPGTDER